MKHKTPTQLYDEDVQSGKIQDDPVQRKVLVAMDRLFQGLMQLEENSWFDALIQKIQIHKNDTSDTSKKGLYLCGGVGIGKTYLMDLFFDALPIKQKIRLHFHHFMQQIHSKLQALQGEINPLKIIARQLKGEAVILCFDELHVTDITDAMLLGELFKALFEEKIVMIFTSNQAPDELYKNGLQRDRFLPAIDLIKQHCELLLLNSEQDYRLQHLQNAGVFFTPLDEAADKAMEKCFEECALHFVNSDPIEVCERLIPVIKRGQDIIWFDFNVLCHVPRSQQDYLEIAQRFSTVMLSHVPIINAEQDNLITYFINLIDILYDHHCLLIMSAAGTVDEIYTQGRKITTFERTKSRLFDMQSQAYMAFDK